MQAKPAGFGRYGRCCNRRTRASGSRAYRALEPEARFVWLINLMFL